MGVYCWNCVKPPTINHFFSCAYYIMVLGSCIIWRYRILSPYIYMYTEILCLTSVFRNKSLKLHYFILECLIVKSSKGAPWKILGNLKIVWNSWINLPVFPLAVDLKSGMARWSIHYCEVSIWSIPCCRGIF